MKLFLVLVAMALAEANNSLILDENPTSRISGPNGTEAKPHSKPWIVNLGGCGGALIGRRFVLTALHCRLRGVVGIGDEVVMGDHDRTIKEEGEQRIRVIDAVSYKVDGIEDYDKADYDILVLEKEVELTNNVQLINLPKPGATCPESLKVCGWGHDFYNPARKLDKLMCLDQVCRPVSKCTLDSQLPGFKLCASYPSEPPKNWLNSACKGDSGGPLFHTDENGLTTIYGVVNGAGRRKLCDGPTIYASVSDERILNWIDETMSLY